MERDALLQGTIFIGHPSHIGAERRNEGQTKDEIMVPFSLLELVGVRDMHSPKSERGQGNPGPGADRFDELRLQIAAEKGFFSNADRESKRRRELRRALI